MLGNSGRIPPVDDTPQAASPNALGPGAAEGNRLGRLGEIPRASGSNTAGVEAMEIDNNPRNQQTTDPTDPLASSDSDSDPESGPVRIPKPAGEAGRKRSGGYNLQAVLESHGWTERQFMRRRVSNSILARLRQI